MDNCQGHGQGVVVLFLVLATAYHIWDTKPLQQQINQLRQELEELEKKEPKAPNITIAPSITDQNLAAFLIPLVAGGALAAYNPKLGMAAGGGTLAIAAIFKKGWAWWVLGIVILALALFRHWNKQNDESPRSGSTNEKA